MIDTGPARQGNPSGCVGRILVVGRYDIARKIENLDPERDHVLIMHYVAVWEFPSWSAGDDTDHAKDALRRINHFRRHYEIANDHFLFWRDVGHHMAIKNSTPVRV